MEFIISNLTLYIEAKLDGGGDIYTHIYEKLKVLLTWPCTILKPVFIDIFSGLLVNVNKAFSL